MFYYLDINGGFIIGLNRKVSGAFGYLDISDFVITGGCTN